MPDRVARAALGWFALTTLVFWLATVRGAFDGPSYQWGLIGLGGRGVGGDYWFPLVGACGALAALAGGWRCKRWAFGVLAAWSLLIVVVMTAVAVSRPGDFRFRGDTLGVDVSLAWIGPVLSAVGAVVCVVALSRIRRPEATITTSWNRRNSRWLAALAAVLPFQFVLFRFGGPESLADQVGVLVTIAQWFLLGRVFQPHSVAPTESKERVRPAMLEGK